MPPNEPTAPQMKSPQQELADMESKAERLEKAADQFERSAKEYEGRRGLLDEVFASDKADKDTDRATEQWTEVAFRRKEAKELREAAANLRSYLEGDGENQMGPSDPKPPIESVLGDIDKSSYGGPKIESVIPDLGHKPSKNTARTVIFAAVGIALIAAVFGLSRRDVAEEAPAAPAAKVADGAQVESDGSASFENRRYYRVISTDPTGDTGDEVCAKVGKSCVGYTALTQAVCMAFHPGAQPSEDFNGSKAGFYCNGAPQGGVCANEANTCHICPACNLNMECGTVIGDLYRETFVECK